MLHTTSKQMQYWFHLEDPPTYKIGLKILIS
jgi:hypothetical protein